MWVVMGAEVRWIRKQKLSSYFHHSLLVIIIVTLQHGDAHEGVEGHQCSHRHPRDDEVSSVLHNNTMSDIDFSN